MTFGSASVHSSVISLVLRVVGLDGLRPDTQILLALTEDVGRFSSLSSLVFFQVMFCHEYRLSVDVPPHTVVSPDHLLF